MFACFLHMLVACWCRSFLFVTLEGLTLVTKNETTLIQCTLQRSRYECWFYCTPTFINGLQCMCICKYCLENTNTGHGKNFSCNPPTGPLFRLLQLLHQKTIMVTTGAQELLSRKISQSCTRAATRIPKYVAFNCSNNTQLQLYTECSLPS